jgi:hypothetical protein
MKPPRMLNFSLSILSPFKARKPISFHSASGKVTFIAGLGIGSTVVGITLVIGVAVVVGTTVVFRTGVIVSGVPPQAEVKKSKQTTIENFFISTSLPYALRRLTLSV